MLCTTYPFLLIYAVQQSLQWVTGENFGLHATKINSLLNGLTLPQLVCGLVGDLVSFEAEEDFCLRCDATGNHSHCRLQVSICQKRYAVHLIIVQKGKKYTHA